MTVGGEPESRLDRPCCCPNDGVHLTLKEQWNDRRNLFVIEDGQVSVGVGGKQLYLLGRGALVGELSFLDGNPRDGEIEIVTKSVNLWMLGLSQFKDLERLHPDLARKFMWNLTEIVVEKLRNTTRGCRAWASALDDAMRRNDEILQKNAVLRTDLDRIANEISNAVILDEVDGDSNGGNGPPPICA